MKKFISTMALLTILFLPRASMAQGPFQLETNGGGMGSVSEFTATLVDGLWNITIRAAGRFDLNNPAGVEFVLTLTTDQQVKVRQIVVECSEVTPGIDTNVVNLVVDRALGTNGGFLRIERISRTVRPQGDAPLRLDVTTRLSDTGDEGNIGLPGVEPGGFVNVDSVKLSVAGNLTAEVGMLSPPYASFYPLVHADVNGSLLNNVSTESSLIDRIHVVGDIGTPGSPVAIAGMGAGHIFARNIYATIDLTQGQLNYFEANGGEFVGTLVANSLSQYGAGPRGLVVRGRVAGSARFLSNTIYPIAIGSLEAGSLLRIDGIADGGPTAAMTFDGDLAGTVAIGRSLLRPLTVTSGHHLTGQVIINGSNDPVNPGVWAQGAPVAVNGATLSPIPHYSQTISTVGTGGVGLVPYALHGQDCDPPNVTYQAAAGYRLVPPSFDFTPVIMRLYGHVVAANPAASPVKIEIQLGAGVYQDVTVLFDVKVHPAVPGGARAVAIGRIPGIMPPCGTFRVSPLAGGLQCDPQGGLVPQGVNVAPFIYYFALVPDCNNNGIVDFNEIQSIQSHEGVILDCNNNGRFDYCDIQVFHTSTDANGDGIPDDCVSLMCRTDVDQSGVVDAVDVATFIQWWADDLIHGTHRADFNLDGLVNPADVAFFIAVWFADVTHDCGP